MPGVATNSGAAGTNGATVTNTNTGMGRPWDIVNIGTAGAVTYDSAHTFHGGAVAVKFVPSTAGNTSVQWSVGTVGTVTQVAWQQWCYFAANPVGSTVYLVRAQSSGSNAFRVGVTTAGKVVTQNAAGTALATSTNSIPLGAVFRVAGHAVLSTTAGVVEASLVTTSGGDSTTVLESLSTSNAVLLASINQFQFGPASATPTSGTYWAGNFTAAFGASASGVYPFAAALRHELASALAGLSGAAAGTPPVAAANIFAGTSGLDLLGALNSANKTTGLDLWGVCNSLAGTTGKGPVDALNSLSGNLGA